MAKNKLKLDDPYNGQFIIAEKMQDVVQDVLSVLEKWNLRQMEKEITLQQAMTFITQQKRNEINQSRMADLNGMAENFAKQFLGEHHE